MATIQVAVSTSKVIHEWYPDERAYGCGAARFVPTYVPTLDNAELDDEGHVTEKSRSYLESGGYRLCKACFRNR